MNPPRNDQFTDRFLDALPSGWTAAVPRPEDASALTDLLRAHEEAARGWASSGEDDVLVNLTDPGVKVRENVLLRSPDGIVRGWATAHDRAAGRMLFSLIVARDLDDTVADQIAEALFVWGADAARLIGGRRGLEVQQIDSGAFADDERQHRWLAKHQYEKVRTWWQMSRPVTADEADDRPEPKPGTRVRRVRREGTGMPEEEDLRTVHDILEESFADHFNSHEESFDEFVSRLREDPGHRWDHWWIADIDQDGDWVPAGALVGAVSENDEDAPDGSYVEYIGVRSNARGRGVAKALLNTIIADAAGRGRNRVGLEVDADSPTRADALYTSLGWETKYVTQSWHRDVPVDE